MDKTKTMLWPFGPHDGGRDYKYCDAQPVGIYLRKRLTMATVPGIVKRESAIEVKMPIPTSHISHCTQQVVQRGTYRTMPEASDNKVIFDCRLVQFSVGGVLARPAETGAPVHRDFSDAEGAHRYAELDECMQEQRDKIVKDNDFGPFAPASSGRVSSLQVSNHDRLHVLHRLPG